MKLYVVRVALDTGALITRHHAFYSLFAKSRRAAGARAKQEAAKDFPQYEFVDTYIIHIPASQIRQAYSYLEKA